MIFLMVRGAPALERGRSRFHVPGGARDLELVFFSSVRGKSGRIALETIRAGRRTARIASAARNRTRDRSTTAGVDQKQLTQVPDPRIDIGLVPSHHVLPQ